MIPFEDPELEQLYQFCRCLLRLLPVPREDQPRELQKFVDVNTVRLVQAARESISPEPGKGVLEHHKGGVAGDKPEEQLEPLSQILKLLNDRFGTNFEEEDKEFLETLEEKLDADAGHGGELRGEHPGERPADVRPQGPRPRAGHDRHELQVLQADQRQTGVRGLPQRPAVRPLRGAEGGCWGRGVELTRE